MTGRKRYRGMRNKPNPKSNPGKPTVYQIRIKGHLDNQWTDWFEGLTITLEEDGHTLLTGPVIDQAALHGLLKKVRDLGMPLVSVIQVQFNETHPYRTKKGDQKMNTISRTLETKDRQVILSSLWIFATLNYIYADVFSLFFHPSAQQQSLAMPQAAVLVFAILMETAIAMVLLSRVLKYGANRWANIAAGLFHTAFVSWSLMGEPQLPYYMFFAGVEILCTLFIVWYAWMWRNPEG